MKNHSPRKVRAVSIVIRDGEILLMGRREEAKDFWVFVGGGVEEGEAVPDAVVRETREETSVAVKLGVLLYRCNIKGQNILDFGIIAPKPCAKADVAAPIPPNRRLESFLRRNLSSEASLCYRPILFKDWYYCDDGTRHDFYWCEYLSGEPRLEVGSSEARKNEETPGRYSPQWVALERLPTILLYPLEVRDWVIEDAQKNFEGVRREESFVRANMRQTI